MMQIHFYTVSCVLY